MTYSIYSSLIPASIIIEAGDLPSRCHNVDLTRCPASSIQTTITTHFELEKIDFPGPLSVQALDFSSKRSYITVTIGSPIVQMNPQVADLGSAYKLAPQSPGLPQTERLSIGVLKSILKLREVSSLSMRTIYSFPKRSSDQTYVNKHQQT